MRPTCPQSVPSSPMCPRHTAPHTPCTRHAHPLRTLHATYTPRPTHYTIYPLPHVSRCYSPHLHAPHAPPRCPAYLPDTRLYAISTPLSLAYMAYMLATHVTFYGPHAPSTRRTRRLHATRATQSLHALYSRDRTCPTRCPRSLHALRGVYVPTSRAIYLAASTGYGRPSRVMAGVSDPHRPSPALTSTRRPRSPPFTLMLHTSNWGDDQA